MPAYRFYDLTAAEPAEMARAAFFSDAAAVTWAMGRAGPGGLEVWQGSRFVGRLHGASAPAGEADNLGGEGPGA